MAHDSPVPLVDHTWRVVLGRCPLCGAQDLREGLMIRELWCFACRQRITKLVLDELEQSEGVSHGVDTGGHTHVSG